MENEKQYELQNKLPLLNYKLNTIFDNAIFAFWKSCFLLKIKQKPKQKSTIIIIYNTFALYKPYIQATFYMENLYKAIQNPKKMS